jgi:hypothetical protein
MEKEKENTKTDTKKEILNAFDLSKKKQISEVCRMVGIASSTFYFHFYKDSDFRRQILQKQQEHLAAKIAAV